jgi:hypothetical protein
LSTALAAAGGAGHFFATPFFYCPLLFNGLHL